MNWFRDGQQLLCKVWYYALSGFSVPDGLTKGLTLRFHSHSKIKCKPDIPTSRVVVILFVDIVAVPDAAILVVGAAQYL